jgi:hypothetical protein
MIRLNTLRQNGTIITRYPLPMPSVFVTVRYVGIMPPLKNIVIRKKSIIQPRDLKSGLERAYAQGVVTTILKAVPASEYNTVFPYPRRIAASLNSSAYPSKVKPLGKKYTCPDITYSWDEMDAIST